MINVPEPKKEANNTEPTNPLEKDFSDSPGTDESTDSPKDEAEEKIDPIHLDECHSALIELDQLGKSNKYSFDDISRLTEAAKECTQEDSSLQPLPGVKLNEVTSDSVLVLDFSTPMKFPDDIIDTINSGGNEAGPYLDISMYSFTEEEQDPNLTAWTV